MTAWKTSAPKRARVYSITGQSEPIRIKRFLSAQRILLIVWLVLGFAPLVLQMRSFVKFVIPHRIPARLVVPDDMPRETANLTDLCRVEGYLLAGVWWNSLPTHYYQTGQGIVCHAVVPQYNTHGNYVIGSSQVTPFHSTPSSCAGESFAYQQYFYHGSIGYYSYYEHLVGTFCARDNTSYIHLESLGTFDINGPYVAEDTGSDEQRKSLWYASVGAVWLVYRALMLRRSYVTCKRYGWRCDQMNQILNHNEAIVFVQESLRLSAHGATNYHRLVLLYLLIEGVMSDLFLVVANDGLETKIQYFSLGYNLSGMLLQIFEIIEHTKCLSEAWRIRLKRLLFSYESSLVGEFVSAAGLQYFLTGLNGSDLKRSRPTALAVSYYFWSLICHGIVVIVILSTIVTVRVLWVITFAWWRYRSLAIFTLPCCVDTTYGARNRMVMLGGYCLQGGKLYYRKEALRAFGLLRVQEEDGAEYLALHKLLWLTVPRNNLHVIGVVSGHQVDPCTERSCTSVVTFFDRRLGGSVNNFGHRHSLFIRRVNRVSAGPDMLNVLTSSVNRKY